jgi:hypothetical protein
MYEAAAGGKGRTPRAEAAAHTADHAGAVKDTGSCVASRPGAAMAYVIAPTRRHEIVLETVCDGALSTPVVVTAMTAK